MSYQDGVVKEQVHFLSQDADSLRGIRGHALYERLNTLGLTHGQFLRALGTSVDDYCAQEFGVARWRFAEAALHRCVVQPACCFAELAFPNETTGQPRWVRAPALQLPRAVGPPGF